MADENVDMLLAVDIDAEGTLKEIAELRQGVADMRAEQTKLDKSTAEGRKEFEKLNVQIKANNKTIAQYERQIVNTLTQEKAQSGSIKSLRAELSNAKAAYAELSREEREGAKGTELLEKTAALNAELKELESAYGDNQRKVGEYENAGKALGAQLSDLTQQLQEMAAAGLQGSDTYKQMFEEATKLKNAQDEVNQGLSNAAKNTAGIEGLAGSVSSVVLAYGAWKQASHLIGIESEELDSIMQKMVVVFGALQAVTQLQALAQKQSNAYRAAANVLAKLGIKTTTAETVARSANAAAVTTEATAENASTAAKVRGVVATKAITAAQWLWNVAMSANPIMLIVVAIAALIAGIAALVSWLGKESDAAKDAKVAQEAYNAELELSEIRLKKLDAAHASHTRTLQLSIRKGIEALKQQGASEEAIRAAKLTGEKELRDTEIEYQKQRAKESQDLITLKTKELKYWVDAQSKVREGSKRWKEYAASIKEAESALFDLKNTLDDANLSIAETMQAQIEANREAEDAAKERAKTARDAAKQAVDDSIARYEAELNAQKTYNEAFIKAEKDYQSSDMKTRQAYARRLFDLNAETERARLDNLRKHNRISEAEYQQSLSIMTAQLTEFRNTQTAELTAFYESEREAINSMLTKTLDEQIAETEKKYADAVKRLGALEGDAAMDNILTAIRLEEEKNAEIARLREASVLDTIKKIEDATKKGYADELIQFQNNERKKLDITEQMLREQVAAKKAAGLTTYAEDAQMEQLALQRTALNLNRDLLLAGDNAKKKHDAKVKALNEELILYADNADKQLEIAQALADAEAELIDARIENFARWRDGVANLMDGLTGLMSANLDRQLQRVQETYDAEEMALADKFAFGLVTEAEYNRDKLKLEKQKAKDEAKIERERAIRERAGKVFSIVTDTAMGIMKAVGASPLTGGLPWSAIVAAVGAANLATVLSEPLPKAARGGLIKGASHAQGGAVIEAEGGEAIMSKRAVSMFAPLLSAINVLGGGVPFAAPLSDGGFVARSTEPVGVTAQDIADAVQGVKIVTLVEDINRGQQTFADIESAGAV